MAVQSSSSSASTSRSCMARSRSRPAARPMWGTSRNWSRRGRRTAAAEPNRSRRRRSNAARGPAPGAGRAGHVIRTVGHMVPVSSVASVVRTLPHVGFRNVVEQRHLAQAARQHEPQPARRRFLVAAHRRQQALNGPRSGGSMGRPNRPQQLVAGVASIVARSGPGARPAGWRRPCRPPPPRRAARRRSRRRSRRRGQRCGRN